MLADLTNASNALLAGNVAGARAILAKYGSPPVTTLSLSGLQGNAGWFTGPVSATLSAVNPVSGVAATYFAVDGGAQTTYTAPFAVSGDGTHLLRDWSVDIDGNAATANNTTINIDGTPPSTTLSVNAGIVTLTATDALSGVASTVYIVDGGAQQTYSAPFSVTGSHTVTYFSTDVAGNSEAAETLTLIINATPTLTSLSPSSATAGTAGFTLTVNGNGFAPSSVVNWKGTALATTYGSVSQLTAAMPASLIGSAGTAAVMVTTPAPGGGASGPKTFTIKAATLASLTLAPTSVVGGAASTGTVKLTGPASAGGLTVNLSSNAAAATVPATVTVPAGQTAAAFPVSTSVVSVSTAARITASVTGQSRTATQTVKPANAPRLINSGGGVVSPFVADGSYSGGSGASTSHAIDLSGTSNPAPVAVYQSQRRGTLTYTLSGLSPGAGYTLRLHFAEFQYFAAGRRVFSVSVNGSPVLLDFDIYAAAGGKAYKAVVAQTGVTANASGQVVVSFTPGAAGVPAVNGLELH